MNEAQRRIPRRLESGQVVGASNGNLDEWDKVRRGKALFAQTLDSFLESDNSSKLSLDCLCAEIIERVMWND